MVKPSKDTASPGNDKQPSTIDNEVPESLKRIVIRPDTIQCIYCVPVELCSGDSNRPVRRSNSFTQSLAIVSRADEACLMALQTQSDDMPAVILKSLPVYQDFRYERAQDSNDSSSDLLVTFASDGKKIHATFPEKKHMMVVLDELRTITETARKNGYRKESNSHRWMDAYDKFGAEEKPSIKRRPRPASSLPQVLPMQRTESEAFVSLRRAASRAASKIANHVPALAAKKHWINARLMDRENEFVTKEPAKVFAGTWNVHGSLPSESLATWLVDQADSKEGFDPDFYVIGLQEMETNKDAYIRYDPTKENAWVQAIFDALGTRSDEYYKVATQQLVTILIIVIAKKKHQPYITEVETNYVGVGLMNMIGNKGGVGVRLRFYDSYLCFIGSHLAAFTDQVDRRNQDFAEICKRLTFTHKQDPLLSYVDHSWNDGGDEGVSFLENHGVKYDWSQMASVFHADFLIWLGDLNYRINLTEPEIKSRLERKQVAKLMDYDQLSIERKAGRAFPMFDEGDIDFLPTYKFDAGTNQYDTSAKRRAPSWTDRILWKKERVPMSSETKEERVPSLKLERYDNCMEMMSSDHKPVYAHMELQIRQIDSKKQKDTKAALARQLAETKDNITKGQISSSFVEFGDVNFMEHKERTLILENTGQVLAPFRFIPKMDETEACPSWLHVHPMSGILGPGEKVVLHFEILIDPTISTPFNEGTEKIDSILVLRLENGKDFFIVVSGVYHPTCFGVYLDQLALMTLPVSEAATAPSDKKSKKQQQHTEPSPQQATLPKELWRLLNFLWNKNMLCLESLFLQSGDRVVSNYIRRCLDTGEQFDTHVLLSGRASEDDTKEDDDTTGANSMIDVLVAFLECLPEPVIPTSMYKQALKAAESAEALSEFKDKLPYIHLNVLLYITSFLKDAIKYAPTSCRQDRIAQIVQLFTVLLRPSIDYKEQNPLFAQQQRERFIHQILNN